MKFRFLILPLIVAILFLYSCNQPQKATQVTLTTVEDSVSYGIGVNIGSKVLNDFQMGKIDSILNMDAVVSGFSEALKKQNETMTAADAGKIVSAYFRKKQETARKEALKKYETNKIEGKNFLEENKSKDGVVTLESGLQYKVINDGSGKKPTATDKVKVHYHGTLIDGTVFDSSVERGTPAEFAVNGVIKGWTEALQLMSEGSKWQLFIPYDLAYGENAAGEKIKPYSTLIFEVELLEVLPAETASNK